MLRCATGITSRMNRSPLNRDGVTPPPVTGALLLEDGSFLLTEDGFHILLE
jgi:hypothetical protein